MLKVELKTKLKITAMLMVAIAMMSASFWLQPSTATANFEAEPKPTPKKSKYSDFSHTAKAHKLECGTCHKFPTANWNKVRPEKEAFPDQTDYPRHESCLNCHRQQFFKGAQPAICSICHTNPSPRDSSRHPFPNPREIFDLSKKGKMATSDFVAAFPHDKHIEIVSGRSSSTGPFINASYSAGRRVAAEESCSVCHKTANPIGTSKDEYLTPPPAKLGDAFWLKKGTFKTAPIGHTTCFTCHSADSGILPAPQTCSACHTLKPPMPPADYDAKLAAAMAIPDKVTRDTWARRESAGAFPHEHFAHNDLSCATCHNVLTIKTDDPATKKVSISSCATCHATPTSDDGGVLNYEADMRKKNATFQCIKCHITFGKMPIPDSHVKALAAAAGK